MRSAEIAKILPENWRVEFKKGHELRHVSIGFPSFEYAAKAAKLWILREIL